MSRFSSLSNGMLCWQATWQLRDRDFKVGFLLFVDGLRWRLGSGDVVLWRWNIYAILRLILEMMEVETRVGILRCSRF